MDNTKKLEIVRNPNTAPEILTQLAEDDDEDILSTVACHPRTPPEALTKLAENNFLWVRCCVAKNLYTPIGVLTQLAEDGNWEVRASVAQNLSTPIEILMRFVDNSNDDNVYPFARQNTTYLQHLAVQEGVCEKSALMPVEWLHEMYGREL